MPAISSPRRGGMEWFGRNLVGSIKCSVSPLCGDHGNRRARTGLRPSRFSPRLSQATDLTVAQAVVDEDEKFAGGRHPGDLLAPALSHPVVVDAGWRSHHAGGPPPRRRPSARGASLAW